MILSFHPIIEADENRLCAGRDPDGDDLEAILRADAVILPQGCRESLYRMVQANCSLYFPNLDVRFDYPGKLGQIRLFRELGVAHPATELYETLADFHGLPQSIELPAVIKLNWGGQGDTVFLAGNHHALNQVLKKVEDSEKSGQSGFLMQKWINAHQGSLRVAIIGDQTISYWRRQTSPEGFGTSVARGAQIDYHAEPELQIQAREAAQHFCQQTGLQLAGFDFIFDFNVLKLGRIAPLMLEINYFFGRSGLGGSQRYYALFYQAVEAWLSQNSLRQ